MPFFARVLGAICFLAGAALFMIGALAPHIGLGEGSQFAFYQAFGIPRHRVFFGGACIALLGAILTAFFCLSRELKQRAHQIAYDLYLGTSCRVAFGYENGELPPLVRQVRLERFLQAGAIILAVCTLAVATISMPWGLDVTDEGLYLYEMTQRQPAARFFISPVAGAFGDLFQNNILYWRYIGLALLVIGAVLFADAIARLIARLKLGERRCSAMLLLICGSVSGGLAFFAYGPPTFSYRLASSAGVLLAYAGVIQASLAIRANRALAWNFVASFAVLMMVLGRPPALPPYLVSLLLLGALLWPVCGWRMLLRNGVVHAALIIGLGALLLLPASLRAEFAAVTERLRAAGEGGYRPSLILQRHFEDLLSLPIDTVALVKQAILIGVGGAVLVFLFRLLSRSRTAKFYLVDILLCAYAALPFFLVSRYLRDFPIMAMAAQHCVGIDAIACQGPTPAQTGREFIDVVAAQFIVVLILLFADYFTSRRAMTAFVSSLRNWGLLSLFLGMATLVSSFYTDVGWFYHAILSLAPLGICLVSALMLAPLKRVSIPLWPTLLALLGFQSAVALDVLHNRVLFPHRQLGGRAAQTQLLSQPATLRGLHVSPQAAALISQVRAKLLKSGFVKQHDLVVAPYNLAGLLVAIDARALGTPWYARSPADCVFLQSDNSDVRKIGRVYAIYDAKPEKSLATCLGYKGLALDRERHLGKVDVGAPLSVNLSVIPVK